MDDFNVLIACTASVATIKLPVLIEQIHGRFAASSFNRKLNIKIVLTDNAKKFLKNYPIDHLNVEILNDEDEWRLWQNRGDPVLHISLTKWAHVCLLAPLDANTLAKIANGLCDNLLTCTIRAWPIADKPLYFCPAMNTFMWNHPVTRPQIEQLQSWGYRLIPCIEKTLICGDTGVGAMAEIDTIVDTLFKCVLFNK